MSWSPDQEIMVLATGSFSSLCLSKCIHLIWKQMKHLCVMKINIGRMYLIFQGKKTLILMTREFDPLMEFPMHPDGVWRRYYYVACVHNASHIKTNPRHENILPVVK